MNTPKSELDARLSQLQSQLAAQHLDGGLIIQAVDLFYLAGTTQQAHLFVPASGPPLLMVRKSYARAREESALENVVPLRSLRELPGMIADHSHRSLKHIGLELDVMPVNTFGIYSKTFPHIEFVDISPTIRQLRSVKSPYEIERLWASARVMQAIMDAAPRILREGITEAEFAAQLEAVALALGHQGFNPVRNWNMNVHFGTVTAGDSAARPSSFDGPLGSTGLSPAMPNSPGLRPIRRGEPVVLDCAVAIDGYLVDQSRVFAIGLLPEKFLAAHAAMRTLFHTIADAARPGVRCSDLYELAVTTAAKMGYAKTFMGYGEGQVGFVGHGVGLELDEWPVIARNNPTILEEGMVLALEPRVVFPDGSVGMENTGVVTPGGLQSITCTPEEIVIV